MKKERRHWSAEDKAKLLRRHLIEKVPISKICEEARLAPSLFQRWHEQFFQNAALALEGKRQEPKKEQQQIEKLEQKIRQKDEVLAELMAERWMRLANGGLRIKRIGGKKNRKRRRINR